MNFIRIKKSIARIYLRRFRQESNQAGTAHSRIKPASSSTVELLPTRVISLSSNTEISWILTFLNRYYEGYNWHIVVRYSLYHLRETSDIVESWGVCEYSRYRYLCIVLRNPLNVIMYLKRIPLQFRRNNLIYSTYAIFISFFVFWWQVACVCKPIYKIPIMYIQIKTNTFEVLFLTIMCIQPSFTFGQKSFLSHRQTDYRLLRI